MRLGSSTLGITLTSSILAGAVAFGTAWGQPGTVLSHIKLNDATFAPFGAALHDGDEFGDAVAGLGDLDGAGPSVVALAVGTVGDDDGGSRRGSVYILFLNGSGSVLSYQKISSLQGGFTGALDSGDEFGGAITSLGDLDGPGPSVAAIAVGAIGDDDGGTERGAFYVLFLNGAGSVLSTQKISSTVGGFTGTVDDGDEIGGSLTNLGDLDGPGPSTCAIATGAVYDDDGGSNPGAVWVMFLSSSGTVLSHQKISNTEGNLGPVIGSNDNFGEDVAYLGDLDGPGGSAATLAVGAVSGDSGRGAVYILFLASNGTVMSQQKIGYNIGGFTAPLQSEDNFGSAVVGLGDLDGSGPSAVAFASGAPADDGIGINRGAVYILFLNSSGTVLSYEEISSAAGNFSGQLDDTDESGSAVAALGDIDGSGGAAQVLASGVSFDDDGGLNRGAVYLLSLDGGAVVSVNDPPAGTAWEGLRPARPNVFSQRTSLSFRIQDAGRARIEIRDAAGRLVRRLLDESLSAGEHQAVWDGSDDSGRRLAPGAYFLRMSANGRILSGRTGVVLLR